MQFWGLNLDFGNVFVDDAGYPQAFTRVNANHVRLFPWNSLADSTVFNKLKAVLDSCQANRISVTIVLNLADINATTGEERAFVRGYPVYDATPPYPLDLNKMRADFANLYAVVGNHPAIHSWDVHNEPAPWHYWHADPYKGQTFCKELYNEIKKYDTKRPVYIGLSNIEAAQTTNYNGNNMLLDANSFTDYCTFHYYPQLGHNDVVWTAQQAVVAVTDPTTDRYFAKTMQIIRANNPRSLPCVLDEFGIATFVPSGETGYLAYTDESGQAAFYNAVFGEVAKYPEIIGINPWEALFTNRFSIFRSDQSVRPAGDVVKNTYASYVNSGVPLYLLALVGSVLLGYFLLR